MHCQHACLCSVCQGEQAAGSVITEVADVTASAREKAAEMAAGVLEERGLATAR